MGQTGGIPDSYPFTYPLPSDLGPSIPARRSGERRYFGALSDSGNNFTPCPKKVPFYFLPVMPVNTFKLKKVPAEKRAYFSSLAQASHQGRDSGNGPREEP